MNDSEEHWLARRLQAALNKAMGGPDWGEISSSWVRVHTTDAADRLPEFVEIIRRVLAECRYPHALMLHIDLQAAWHDEDAGSWKDPEQAELERERAEEEEWRARNREEAELREREHRLRQLRQEGAKIDPKEFEPPPAPPNIETGGDEPGLFEEDEPHPQAEQYDLFGEINEEGLFVTNHTVDVGERLMGREAEKL